MKDKKFIQERIKALKMTLSKDVSKEQWEQNEIDNQVEFEELSKFENKLDEVEDISHEVYVDKAFDDEDKENEFFEDIKEATDTINNKKNRYQKQKLEDYNKGIYKKGGNIPKGHTKELETEDFIWYVDENGEYVIMIRKSDGSVASDNYFAENDLYERMVEIANGREKYIYLRPESKQYLKEYIEDYEKGGATNNLQKYYKEQKNEIEKIKNYGKGEYEVAWLPTPNGSREYAEVEANSWKEAVDIVKKGEKENGFDITNVEVGIDTPNEYLGRFPIEDIINPNKNYPTFAKGGKTKTAVDKIYEAIYNDKINLDKGSRNWKGFYLDITRLVWDRNMQEGYTIDVYTEKYGTHIGTIDIDNDRMPSIVIEYDRDAEFAKGGTTIPSPAPKIFQRKNLAKKYAPSLTGGAATFIEERTGIKAKGKGLDSDSGRELEKGGLTPAKAQKMLDDGEANGQPLTDKQKRHFGAVANQDKPRTINIKRGRDSSHRRATGRSIYGFEKGGKVSSSWDNFFETNPDKVLGTATKVKTKFGKEAVVIKGDISSLELIDVPNYQVDLPENFSQSSSKEEVSPNTMTEENRKGAKNALDKDDKTLEIVRTAEEEDRLDEELYTFDEVDETYNGVRKDKQGNIIAEAITDIEKCAYVYYIETIKSQNLLFRHLHIQPFPLTLYQVSFAFSPSFFPFAAHLSYHLPHSKRE